MMSRTMIKYLSSVALASIVAGCAGSPIENGPTRLSDTEMHERTPDSMMSAQSAVNFFKEKPITILETNNDTAFEILVDAGEEIPNIMVGEINAAPMNFTEFLNQITEQVGLSWVVTGKGKEALMSKDIYFVQRSETQLASVLEEVSKSTSAFFRMEGDRIIFSQDELFVTNVPRMANSLEILTEGISNVGATEVFADNLTGTISFRADRESLTAVQALMRSFEKGRDMIVYDFWIIERSLTDATGFGVNAEVGLTTGNGSSIGGSSEGGIGLVDAIASGSLEEGFFSGNLGNIGVEVAANMVRQLGETETLARPTISMLSGASSSFESGQKSEYIREVNSTTSDGVTTDGTEVRELSVGVKVEVSGAHNGGVISTDIELDVSELISFDEFDTGEVRLRLPKTSERKLSAHLEARPGDVLALGGIIRDRASAGEKGITPIGIPTGRTQTSEKTETIILVRPRLVQIRPGKKSRPGEILKVQANVSRAPNALGEVLSDEARTKRILEELQAK